MNCTKDEYLEMLELFLDRDVSDHSVDNIPSLTKDAVLHAFKDGDEEHIQLSRKPYGKFEIWELRNAVNELMDKGFITFKTSTGKKEGYGFREI